MRISKGKVKELLDVDIEDDYAYIEIINEKKYKSNQQTRLFHSLLMCFWKSGCSSFNSYEDLRNYYKEQAHLLEYQFKNDLESYTKECVWKALKFLPISEDEKKKVIELLKGKVLIWHSWSECSKEMATLTLDKLISDMWEARVDSSSQANKFKEIVEGMNSWYD